MNKKRYILLALILLTMSLGMTAKNKTVQKVYLYGFSASFKDSVVYFTDIQELENVANTLLKRVNPSAHALSPLPSTASASRRSI